MLRSFGQQMSMRAMSLDPAKQRSRRRQTSSNPGSWGPGTRSREICTWRLSGELTAALKSTRTRPTTSALNSDKYSGIGGSRPQSLLSSSSAGLTANATPTCSQTETTTNRQTTSSSTRIMTTTPSSTLVSTYFGASTITMLTGA